MTEISPARFVLDCLFAPAERGLVRHLLRRRQDLRRRPKSSSRWSTTS